MDKRTLDAVKAEMGYTDGSDTCDTCTHCEVEIDMVDIDDSFECSINSFPFKVSPNGKCRHYSKKRTRSKKEEGSNIHQTADRR